MKSKRTVLKARNIFNDHYELVALLKEDEQLLQKINEICQVICDCFDAGHKVMFCGNGGSAADSEHIAAELSGKFKKNRAPLFAEALHVNSAAFSAISNDYGYEHVFRRLFESKYRPGDILIAYSTSGQSDNIIKLLEYAHSVNCTTIGFCGSNRKRMSDLCKIIIDIPSAETARVQEMHMLISHIICELVEDKLFPDA